jgi:competence protein ComEC
LSSVLAKIDGFLANRPFERGPWLSVAFGTGVAAWVVLPGPWDWAAFLAGCAGLATLGLMLEGDERTPHLRVAVVAMALFLAAGCATIWTKSAFVGARGIDRPMVAKLSGTVVDRQEQGAQDRVRLLIEGHVEGIDRVVRVRVNLKVEDDNPAATEGATVHLRARLMPPAPPMLPGSYDFARSAWFQGLAATGSVIGPVTVDSPAQGTRTLRQVQQRLADHVRARLSGSPGAIAAAFASGDRGSIAQTDEDAMRDAGLTHLLSISGLHVSAVIAAVYVLAIRLLALWPWLALRVRLPLVAAACGALAGIAYTLLTGAEVPTIRSCIGAVLVLAALALGRDPLSLRLVAVAALFVMIFWPEAVPGPSFQMSFGSVIAIIAFDSSAPIRRLIAPRDEGRIMRLLRHLAMLLATGVVIELALMPMGLFHFHRAGVYGALANVVAIPLTTFVTMPLIAVALFMDLGGLGSPAWWLVGKSLETLLWLAHVTAAQPGAVTMMPGMTGATYGLFIGGLLWLALWTGRVRLWGFAPIALGTAITLLARPPDLMIAGDGRNVGITGEGADLLVLRMGRSDFARDNMLEMAGMTGEAKALDEWPGARCNPDFCSVVLTRAGRRFVVLMARGRDMVDDLPLAAACERVDIVIADRWLPMSCKPRMLKADRRMLSETGGLAINLSTGRIRTVAQTQGHHGWYRWPEDMPPRPHRSPSPAAGGPQPRAGAFMPPEQISTQPSP